VAYEHRVYEFQIPLNEVAANIGAQIRYGFGCYGTVAVMPPTKHSACGMEWGIVNTPSWEDLEILPASDILDYDIGGDGDTIYAVLELESACTEVGWYDPSVPSTGWEHFALVKSTDGGVTWSDITDNVQDAANLPDGLSHVGFGSLSFVSVAPDDEDWVAVVGYKQGPASVPMVVVSKDGGDNFSYAGDMNDGATWMVKTYDLDVSIEVDGIHNIAVAGITSAPAGAIFRLKAGTWLSASWEDTTDSDYPGWDAGVANAPSEYVIACEFSPNFDLDDTIVIIGIDLGTPAVFYIQSGIWESAGSWNNNAGFPNAVQIKADGDTLGVLLPYQRCAGLSLPADYDGSDSGARSFFIYVNAVNVTTTIYGGWVIRVDNNALSPVCGPPGDPLLASIDVHGDADTGKLMIGEYVQWDNDAPDVGAPIEAECCAGVRVWHTEELDFCCPQWDGAC
jgi:hypothetical protein